MLVNISSSPLPFEVTVSCPVADSIIVIEQLPTSVTIQTILDGRPGETGKSAYQSAVEFGFTGTEEEFATQYTKTFDQLRGENPVITGGIDFDKQGRATNLLPAENDDDAMTLAQGREMRDEAKDYADEQIATASGNAVATANAYTDAQLVAVYKAVGDWDFSAGTYPSTRGSGAAIRRGDTFNVTVAGNGYDVGDAFYANMDAPGQNPARWSKFEVGTDQATESSRGTLKIANTATLQDENTNNNADAVTGVKFWIGLARFAAISRTISGLWSYVSSPIFSSLSASQYVKTDANKQLVSQAGIPAADLTGLDATLANTTVAASLNTSPNDSDNFAMTQIAGGNTYRRTTWFDMKAAIATFLTGRFNNIIINDTVASSVITATTSNQAYKAYLIPANTFANGDFLMMNLEVERLSGTAGSATQGVYLNTIPTLTGANLVKISGHNSGATTRYWWAERRIIFFSGTQLKVFGTNTNNTYDLGTDTNVPTTINYNVANAMYLITSVVGGANGDTFQQNRFAIWRMRQKLAA